MTWTRKDGRVYARRSYFRTPRGGRVTINGATYKPGREPLPKRLWGVRALFHVIVCDRIHVSLWGSEAMAKATTEEAMEWPGPFCDEGTFKWEWWVPS